LRRLAKTINGDQANEMYERLYPLTEDVHEQIDTLNDCVEAISWMLEGVGDGPVELTRTVALRDWSADDDRTLVKMASVARSLAAAADKLRSAIADELK